MSVYEHTDRLPTQLLDEHLSAATSFAVSQRFSTCHITLCAGRGGQIEVLRGACTVSVCSRAERRETHLRDRRNVYAGDRRLHHILAAGFSFWSGLPSTSSAPAY
jgi:hypothetical protein